MKKMNHARFQVRLKLHRETVRFLTEPDLRNVAGGKEVTPWPPRTLVC